MLPGSATGMEVISVLQGMDILPGKGIHTEKIYGLFLELYDVR
jgi:hypothetical protein